MAVCAPVWALLPAFPVLREWRGIFVSGWVKATRVELDADKRVETAMWSSLAEPRRERCARLKGFSSLSLACAHRPDGARKTTTLV